MDEDFLFVYKGCSSLRAVVGGSFPNPPSLRLETQRWSIEMAHGPKKQSTGSAKGNRDQHQTRSPKGPGNAPGPTKGNYVPPKFRR